MVLGDDRDVVKLSRLAGQARELVNQLGQGNDQLVTRSFKVLSPDGGFYDTNVQRLLAQSRFLRYDNLVRSIYGIGLPE